MSKDRYGKGDHPCRAFAGNLAPERAAIISEARSVVMSAHCDKFGGKGGLGSRVPMRFHDQVGGVAVGGRGMKGGCADASLC